MNEVQKMFWKIPWKHKLILVVLSIVNIVFTSLISTSMVVEIMYFLLSEVLLLTSYFDIRTRIIPDWIHVLMLMIGFIGFNPVRSIAGLILTPVPFLIIALLFEGSIGGGDVKLIGACGFVLGFEKCVIIAIFANVFAILYALGYYFSNKEITRMKLPFVPFLYVGWMVVMKIFN